MKRRLSKQELVLVAGAVLIGCFLRFSELSRLGMDQFDEGVYSSGVWYEDAAGGVYPARHLYAPPLLPWTIEISAWFFPVEVAPFIPSLLAGSLTILVVWGFTRSCFGMAAGLIVVMLVALSDFHIVYSRTALTDVPVLLWIVLSVWLGISGIQQPSPRRVVMAGFVCGLGWWTKYSGWLPLAILSSGSVFWWIIVGRRDYPLKRLVLRNLTMAAVAVLCWLPWLVMLQSHGGYFSVRANHAAYSTGFSNWLENLTVQFTWFYDLDSWLGVLAMTLGMVFAGTHRWWEARSSTWNSGATAGSGVTSDLLVWFLMAAVWLPLMTLLIGLFGILVCVGLGGLAGQFLWPVLTQLRDNARPAYDEHSVREFAESDERRGWDDSDHNSGPSLDPRLSVCVVTAWLFGMLLMTPTYTPFPRLMLPLIAALWIAAASGIGWWIEANINVARRSALQGTPAGRTPGLRRVLGGIIMLSVFLMAANQLGAGLPLKDELLMLVQGKSPRIHEPRTGLRDAATEVAELTRTEMTRSEFTGGDDRSRGSDVLSSIVYVFGEPALLYYLNQLNVVSVPVADLDFPAATLKGKPLPTFFVFGPNALRTPNFMYDWIDSAHRYEHVGNVEFRPSFVLLSNLFRPGWIYQHEEDVQVQVLEVYRLRP